MGCLERLSRVDPSSVRFEGFTRDHRCIGKVWGTSLRPNKQSIESQRSTPGAILKDIKGI